jgi:hypothetical protein
MFLLLHIIHPSETDVVNIDIILERPLRSMGHILYNIFYIYSITRQKSSVVLTCNFILKECNLLSCLKIVSDIFALIFQDRLTGNLIRKGR